MIRQFFDTMIVASTDKVVIMTQQNLFLLEQPEPGTYSPAEWT